MMTVRGCSSVREKQQHIRGLAERNRRPDEGLDWGKPGFRIGVLVGLLAGSLPNGEQRLPDQGVGLVPRVRGGSSA